MASDANGRLRRRLEEPVRTGAATGVFAQRYDAAGARRAGPSSASIRYTTGTQYRPGGDVSGGRGSFVVAWQSVRPGRQRHGIFAQRYDATGAPRGGEFRVNTYTTADQQRPRASPSDAERQLRGRLAERRPGRDGYGVFAQRFDAAGVPRGAEFRVNTLHHRPTSTAGRGLGRRRQLRRGLAEHGPGRHRPRASSRSASSAAGRAAGAEFRVNTYTTGAQREPDVARATPSGSFVVVWRSYRPGRGRLRRVRASASTATGAPLGAEFRVNTYTTFGGPGDARGGRDAERQLRRGLGQLRRRTGAVTASSRSGYDATRRCPRGPSSRSTRYTTSIQGLPAVASDASGNFVVAWDSLSRTERLAACSPSASAGSCPRRWPSIRWRDQLRRQRRAGAGRVGRGVRPSWRNVNGAPQTFGRPLLNIDGPAGRRLRHRRSRRRATARWPMAPAGPCTDCYARRACPTRPRGRPRTGTRSSCETITPDAHGQRQRWLLHVGDSFTDVPRANGFYRFVETLLHHGVTGGCPATTYCPASSTTREQMAVFVLVAKEGAGLRAAGLRAAQRLRRRSRDAAPSAAGSRSWPAGASSAAAAAATTARRPGHARADGGLRAAHAGPGAQPARLRARRCSPTCPASSPFCRWIEELARRGVVSGCGGGNYCPTAAGHPRADGRVPGRDLRPDAVRTLARGVEPLDLVRVLLVHHPPLAA